MKITITTDHPRSSHGVPVCIIGGSVVDDATGLRACMESLDWTRADLIRETGKAYVDHYLYRGAPVPAEVWNVLSAAIFRLKKV